MEPSRCGVHPDALAVATCRRCGRFVCESCLELEEAQPYCAECHSRAEVSGRQGWPFAALVVALWAVVFGPLLSVPVIIWSTVHLRRIAAGRERASAEQAWRRARLTGWLALVLFVLLVVTLVVFARRTAFFVVRSN